MPAQNSFVQSNQFQANITFNGPQIEEVFDQAWPSGTNTYAGAANNVVGSMDLDWDVGGLFMVPANWPMNLPSPCKFFRPPIFQVITDPQSFLNICTQITPYPTHTNQQDRDVLHLRAPDSSNDPQRQPTLSSPPSRNPHRLPARSPTSLNLRNSRNAYSLGQLDST